MGNWVYNKEETGSLPQWIITFVEPRGDLHQERTLMTASPKLLPCSCQHRDLTHTPENSYSPSSMSNFETVPYCTILKGTLGNLEVYRHWTYKWLLFKHYSFGGFELGFVDQNLCCQQLPKYLQAEQLLLLGQEPKWGMLSVDEIPQLMLNTGITVLGQPT